MLSPALGEVGAGTEVGNLLGGGWAAMLSPALSDIGAGALLAGIASPGDCSGADIDGRASTTTTSNTSSTGTITASAETNVTRFGMSPSWVKLFVSIR
jgi:hypothetical protein